MTDPRNIAALSDADFERALIDLGSRIAFPPTPDFGPSVRARIASDAREPRRADWLSVFSPRRTVAAAAIALLILLAGALAIFPGFRTAVADLFGVRGVKIVIERETPTPVASPALSPVASELFLGRPATLAEAQATAPFAIHRPDSAAHGEPDEVYLRALTDGNTMVSLIFYPTAELPETEETGVGALLMQFEARDTIAYIGKGVYEEPGSIQRVLVNGQEAWWISGSTRLTLLQDPTLPCCPPSRPSGNILLWEEDGVTFRLESKLTRPAAIALAETVFDLEETSRLCDQRC